MDKSRLPKPATREEFQRADEVLLDAWAASYHEDDGKLVIAEIDAMLDDGMRRVITKWAKLALAEARMGRDEVEAVAAKLTMTFYHGVNLGMLVSEFRALQAMSKVPE